MKGVHSSNFVRSRQAVLQLDSWSCTPCAHLHCLDPVSLLLLWDFLELISPFLFTVSPSLVGCLLSAESLTNPPHR